MPFEATCLMCNAFWDNPIPAKTTARVGKTQNGRPAAVKQPPKRDMKNFKNVDSKLANLIMNEIVDRYQKHHNQQDIFPWVKFKKKSIAHLKYFFCSLQWSDCVI